MRGAGVEHVYCDVDGTLLIWPTVAGSPKPGEKPKLNVALIEKLRQWQSRTAGQLVIWSRNGSRHAEMARDLCGLNAICLMKPDVLIDDADWLHFKKKLLLVNPDGFTGREGCTK